MTAKPYLAVTADGHVIISNPANARIELYDQQGQPVVAWELPDASNGAKGRPVGLALDGKDSFTSPIAPATRSIGCPWPA